MLCPWLLLGQHRCQDQSQHMGWQVLLLLMAVAGAC
jgi:hypothetical protein